MGHLTVNVPEAYLPERSYILNVLFRDFLGLDYEMMAHKNSEVTIQCRGINDKTIILEDVLFKIKGEYWLILASMPKCPLLRWNVAADLPEATVLDRNLPVIYGRQSADGKFYNQQDGIIRLGLDILGSSFFMLTRYEEMVLRERDQHSRFPASASLAFKECFLERPIINEYLEILWAAMKRQWPGLQRKTRRFKIFPTHDVDIPYTVNGLTATRVARIYLGDLLKRKSPTLAAKRWKSWLNTRKYGCDHDLNNTFDYIMDKSEAQGLKSAFYFMANCANKRYDGNYSLQEPWIRQLLRKIYRRGHEIGLHPSYDTYLDFHKTTEEFQYLQKICQEENIQQERWGGRQHYLRWEAPTTWSNWVAAGLDYDSTLGYADQPGFRCGTCYDFPAYDLKARKQLKLRERPLIVMEGTLLGGNYQGLVHNRAWAHIHRLIAACRLFQGDFVFLWHNGNLIINKDRNLYENILNEAISR